MPGEGCVREVRFGAEGVTLAGLLGVPAGEAVAGVVLVGGSGPSDRHNDGYWPWLRRPHLAIFGGADELVPVADSIRLFSGAACDVDRDHRATLTVEVFPGADHRVRRDGVLAPGYLPTLTKWIHATA
ncbi:alpha/beta hydrolase family protein [Actinomadura coerulea]|uniref:alpha/beta hydrolase family protein n=1 Tax=Actinomadura coerulea TaxID=46159 RepID=UPI00342F054C